ncbi:MAG: hypothetical protein EON58_13490 [Alphaproteobacteria bacterium]|nr:MAG: hypothetical protein EON58_13490 [Alphaproteobacteria bacterium]
MPLTAYFDRDEQILVRYTTYQHGAKIGDVYVKEFGNDPSAIEDALDHASSMETTHFTAGLNLTETERQAVVDRSPSN